MKWTAYFLIAALCISASVLTVDLGMDRTETISFSYSDSKYEQACEKAGVIQKEALALQEKTLDVKEQLKNAAQLASMSETTGEGSSRGDYYRKDYMGMDMNQKCGYSKSELEAALKGTKLEGIGEYALAAEHIHGVNAVFIISIAQHESGNGRSRLAIAKNNLFGLGAYDASPYKSAVRYESRQECILDFAKIIRKRYFDRGRYKLGEIGSVYASDPKWPERIARIMGVNEKKILK